VIRRVDFTGRRAGRGCLPGRVVEVSDRNLRQDPIALQVIAEAQKKEGLPPYRRRACARSAYAKKLGVDIDNLLVSQPDYGEQASRSPIPDRLGQIDVLVVIGAALCQSRTRRRDGRHHMGSGG